MTRFNKYDYESAPKKGIIFGLVSDLMLAAKIAQAAKVHHLEVHNFDKAEPLVKSMSPKLPLLVILDWDGCEPEAFKVLKDLAFNADLRGVPSVGYVSNHKPAALAQEAKAAGCHRVYGKTEFQRELSNILMRYTK